MHIVKVFVTTSILLMSGFVTAGANAAHRHYGNEGILHAAQNFEQASWRMHKVLRRHESHYGINYKAKRLARAAQKLRRVVGRGAPDWLIRKQLAAVSQSFLVFRHEYRHFRASHRDRRIARSYRQLSYAHDHLRKSTRWSRERPHEWSTLNFSMSF